MFDIKLDIGLDVGLLANIVNSVCVHICFFCLRQNQPLKYDYDMLIINGVLERANVYISEFLYGTQLLKAYLEQITRVLGRCFLEQF